MLVVVYLVKEMEITADNVERALHQFYHDASTQMQVHQWLTSSQISQQAWTFAWQLLDKEKGTEVQFFGANCLHIKVSRYWYELKPEQIEPLRSQLFDHIARFALGPKVVLTRLCVTLASFALHTMPEMWPDAVQGIINTFQHHNLPHLQPEHICLVLLELLTVLPEEMNTCPLTPYRKGVCRNELTRSSPLVLRLLQSLLVDGSPGSVFEQALKCFSSWAQFGVPLPDVESLTLQMLPSLQNEMLFDTAIDTLTNIFTMPDNIKYPQSQQKMLIEILKVKPLLTKAIQDKDMDKVQSLVRLFTCVGDSSSRLLMTCSLGDQQQLARDFVTVMLECTALPGYFPVDESCSDLTFGFWYNLQDEIVASEAAQYALLAQVFIPYYMSLVNVLLQKVQYPSDKEYEMWNAEEKEQFRCYRQDIADTFMYAYSLLHDLLLKTLCQMLANIINKPDPGLFKWQEVEALLFAMTSVAESIDLQEIVSLPQMFQMLTNIPCHHQTLVSQALYLTGAYAQWISGHPEVLGSVLPLMLEGLKDTNLAQPATLALKEVIRENQHHLFPYVNPILTVSKTALEAGNLKARDLIRLMACLGYVLSVLPVPEIMNYLNIVLAPHIQQLNSLANAEHKAEARAAILLRLNMLSWLFSSLNIYWREDVQEEEEFENAPRPPGPQPVQLILKDVIPVLKNVLTHWFVDVAVVEGVCEMLKRAARTLMDDFSALAEDTSQLVIQMFQAAPYANILDVARQLMILFSSDVMYKDISLVLFHSICNKGLALYESGIREYPDVADGFMAFLAQIVKKYPQVFLDDNCNLEGLFHAAVISLVMPELPTVKSTCSFLSEFINRSDENPKMLAVVRNQAPALFERLMKSIAGESPRTVVDSMADVFVAMKKTQLELLAQLLNQMVNQDGFPSPHCTKQEKEQFTSQLLRDRANKTRVKETISEYTLRWRGLFGTEYAAQTNTILSS